MRFRVTHHRVGRGRLLGEMNERVGRKALHRVGQEFEIAAIADRDGDLVPGHLFKARGALGQRRRRDQRIGVSFLGDFPPHVVVDDADVVAGRAKVHGGRPSEIAVATENENSHAMVLGLLVCLTFQGVRGARRSGLISCDSIRKLRNSVCVRGLTFCEL